MVPNGQSLISSCFDQFDLLSSILSKQFIRVRICRVIRFDLENVSHLLFNMQLRMNLDYLNFDLKAPYGTPTGTPKANRKNSQQNPPHINPFPSSSKVLIYLINSSSVDWILKWESLWLISFIPVFLNISRDSVGFIRFFIGLILAFLKISCAILKLNLSISKISTRYS